MISTSSKVASKMSFRKIFLCKGLTNSLIDVRKSSLELSHLFGTTSFDSCLCSKPEFLLKTEKDAKPNKIWLHIIIKKRNFDPEDSNEFF